MKQYQDLLKTVLEHGAEHNDRTGVGTVSYFGYQTRFDLREGFPLVTTKRVPFRWICEELFWFLSGDTNEASLRAKGVDIWKEWADVYQAKRLPEGEYLGRLYDIGFDRPETHAIRKGGTLYYAFYAKRFHGAVPLRGLDALPYRVRDYVAGRDLGRVTGPQASLPVSFERYLLVEATPE